MIPAPAQYLLRFDDLCPTVSRERWRRFRSLIEEFRLRPILAIVPDNCDPELQVSPPDPAFWEQMRALEAAGATIGLHGYRHLCSSRGRSLLGLDRMSEFAGVAIETQRAWIREGLRILRGHGLNPQSLGRSTPRLRQAHSRGASTRRNSIYCPMALRASHSIAAESPGFRSSFGAR